MLKPDNWRGRTPGSKEAECSIALGNALYWFWSTAAILLAIGGFIKVANESNGHWSMFVAFELVAALAWLMGRVCRYVLSDR
jgi:hypothetical protein